MYAAYVPINEEDYFVNINNSKNIECIIPTSDLLINFRANGMRIKKPCFVYAEKMDFKGLVQVRLTEKCDQRRMYITTVDSGSFHELKQDQSLHVTFGGFVENLVSILQDCQAGKLEISLVQMPSKSPTPIIDGAPSDNQSSSNYQLQFVEMRSFKNLIHLSLPCRMAPLNVVLFYMNSIVDALQNKNKAIEQSLQQLQIEVHAHLRHVEQLNTDNDLLREKLTENTRILNQRHAEEVQQLQEGMRKASEQRQTDNEHSRKTIATLQAQLERSGSDRANVHTEKVQEQKRNEKLTEELASMKAHVSSMKEQNENLHADIAVLRNSERKTDMHLSESRKHINELQEKLKKYDKAKADVVAELEAEKKISQTKRQALEMATEEISKANEIILKQSQELMKIKKTIGWRTEVALRQEKAINEKDKQIKMRDDEIIHMRVTIEELRLEIPRQLDSMQKFAISLEMKYTEQIQTLKEKLKTVCRDNKPPYPPSSFRRK